MHKKLFISVFLIPALLLSACGKKKNTEKNSGIPVRPVTQTETETEEMPQEKTPRVITYTVKLSGKTLSLYETDGELQKVITSMEINPGFYPAEDIKGLEKGITVPCLEDGYEILENFAN